MPARDRTRSMIRKGGTYRIIHNDVVLLDLQRNSLASLDRCIDVSGNRKGQNDFYSTSYENDFDGLSGTEPVGGPRAELRGWPPDLADSLVEPLTLPDPEDLSNYTILSRTSLSKPLVDMPVFLKELRELPKMVKLAGNSVGEKAASANLSWQFGWKPLLSDLSKLMDFQSHVDKRVAEIQSMAQNGGISRQCRGETKSVTASGSITVNGYPSVTGTFTKTSSYRRWYSARWKPRSLPNLEPSALRNQAVRALLGADVSPATIWEATPWSWLVDWFGDVGDYLSAYRNTVPADGGWICRMTEYKTEERITWPPGFWVSGGAASRRLTSKVRIVGDEVSPSSPLAGIPFLEPRKLSILGSLAILRRR